MTEHYSGSDPAVGCGLMMLFGSMIFGFAVALIVFLILR